MFYENWMEYIKDDAKITKIAIPGAHNAGTKGMVHMGCCQNGNPLEQYEYGVRKFGIRYRRKKGEIRIAHGISTGMSGDEAFAYIGEILARYNDFIILDIRRYGSQKLGPVTIRYKGDPCEIDELVAKHLEPEKYAFTDFDDIRDVTMEDIRKSGKRYIIHSEEEEYKFSRNVKLLEPWDAKVFGYKPEKFSRECVNYLRDMESEGFFWFQTQQTPNPGTENGLTWPDKLDELDRPYFPGMMAAIAADPVMLEKVNIVAGDFMTRDHMKENEILYFNLLKDAVKPEFREEYAKAIGKEI